MAGVRTKGPSPLGKRAAKRASVRKPAKKRKVQNTRISVQKYREMWEAYQVEQTGRHVARTCGVCRATADRYIDEGDPDRGLIPIAERFRRVQAEMARKEDLSLSVANKGTMKIVRKLKGALEKRAEKLEEEFQKLDPNQLPRHLKLIKDMEQDLLVDVRAQEKPRAPVITTEESILLAHTLVRFRQEKAKQAREAAAAEAAAQQATPEPEPPKPKTKKVRRLRPPPNPKAKK